MTTAITDSTASDRDEPSEPLSEQIAAFAARSREQCHERDELLRTLAMWAKVEEQGIDPETVATFGFDPGLLTIEELQALPRRPGVHSPVNPYDWPVVRKGGKLVIAAEKYNYVTLKDGTRAPLRPMIDRP